MLKPLVIALACWATIASAAGPDQPTPTAAMLAAERTAMARLALYDGLYTGSWKSVPIDGGSPSGGVTVHRVGPFLGGTVKVMEGRNYTGDGALAFNGMMILSFDPAAGNYRLRIYANGRAIDAEAVMNGDGYYFDVPTPGEASFRRIRITVSPTSWIEHVEFHDGDRPVREEAELVLSRVGESDWPLGRPNPTPVPPK